MDVKLTLCLLNEEDQKIVNMAIEQLLQCVAQSWFMVIEKLPFLIQLFQRGIYDSKLPLLISKILFFADRVPESVSWALKGQIDFSERSLYSDAILSSVVQQYREVANGKILENSIEKKQLENVIEILIQKSIQFTDTRDTMQLLGIIVDLQKWEFVKKMLLNLEEKDFCFFLENLNSICND